MAGESAGSTREKLQHTENALADCQEMLEELQAYSLKQSDEINFLGGQLNVSLYWHKLHLPNSPFSIATHNLLKDYEASGCIQWGKASCKF